MHQHASFINMHSNRRTEKIFQCITDIYVLQQARESLCACYNRVLLWKTELILDLMIMLESESDGYNPAALVKENQVWIYVKKWCNYVPQRKISLESSIKVSGINKSTK